MGYDEVFLEPPRNYLKKGTRKIARPYVGKLYI